MWEVSSCRLGAASADDQVAFVVFWMLIGAIEVSLGRTLGRGRAQYLTNKWFLLTWRDLALVESRPSSSYRDASQRALGNLEASISDASYQMKLGLQPAVPWATIQREQRRALFEALFPYLTSASHRHLVHALVHDPRKLTVDDLVREATAFAKDLGGRRAALKRLRGRLR